MRPLHFQRDENGTSTWTGSCTPPRASAIASAVGFRPASVVANAPSSERTSASERPPSGTISSSARVPSVSVPVLSTQTTSTPASDSTADSRCTSAPRRAMRAAPTANATEASSTRPSGTSVTSPAVAVDTACRIGVLWYSSAAISSAAIGTITTIIRRRRRLMSRWSGDRSRRSARAVSVNVLAYASSPTMSAR